MLLNYLTITLRHFRRNYLYATLNVLGLAIGLAAFMLIAIYVHYETSYENFHSRAERIYRPTYHFQSEGDYEVHWARVPVDYINELPNDMPEVEALIRLQNYERKYVRVGNEKFAPQYAYATDPEVFRVFDFPLIAGDTATALARPQSVVVTESVARRYFGHADVMGQTLSVATDFSAEEIPYTVTGVMADVPSHTHMPVEMLFSFQNAKERSGWAYVYVLLQKGADVTTLQAKMPDFVRKYTSEDDGLGVSFVFQPLPDIHLHSDLAREITPNGNGRYVAIFFLVGGFVLLIALINYVNLSSALALGRVKEVGIRTVLGAHQRQVMIHTWIESVGYHLLAVGLGGGLAYLVFPYFRQLTGVAFLLSAGWFALAMILVAILSGLLSGLYPALLLTSVRAREALRQRKSLALSRVRSGFNVKRAMVTLQFGVSMLLIASALVAYDQFRFLHEKNLGMTTEQIVAFPDVPNSVTQGYPTFKERVASLAGVQQVAACMQVPSDEIRDTGPVRVAGVNDDPQQAPMMDMQIIDPDFVEMMNLRLLAGEAGIQHQPFGDYPTFTEDYNMYDYLISQKRTYLINETAMRQLGWSTPQEAIGQNISWAIDNLPLATGPITGVVQDYHQESLKNQVDPTVLVYESIWLRTFLVKVATPHVAQTMTGIQAVWDDLYPAYPMEYHFLDELFGKLYTGERVQLRLLAIFSGLAILIALLGLFSLVAYSLRTRRQEIAIRRVLGADLLALVRLIGREYLRVMLVGGLMALPLSYWAVTRWLQDFAYHVNVSVLWYGLTLGVVGVLLLVAVSLQTRLSTSDNPAEVLKDQ